VSRYRPLDLFRLVWGLLELLGPRHVARIGGADGNRTAENVVRVLGARDVAQATMLPRVTREAALLGAAVDGLHALSMVGLAVVRPAWRRPALTSATISSAFAVAGLAGRRSSGPAPVRQPAEPVASAPVFTVTSDAVRTGPKHPALADAQDAEREREELLRKLKHARDAGDAERMIDVAHEYAGQVGARTRRLLAERGASRRVASVGWFAGVVLVVAGIWLLVGQWALGYPYDVTGQNTALRDTGFAVLVTLAGLRLWWVARERDHQRWSEPELAQVLVTGDRETARAEAARQTEPVTGGTVAIVLAGLAGAALVAAGALMPHAKAVDGFNELLTGLLVLLCTIGAWRGRREVTTRRSTT
jgi:hypothetical protein